MKKMVAASLAIALLAGGCAVQPPSPAIPDDPAVKTDWSALTAYVPDKNIYTRRYPERTDTLILADNYGPLVPFLGERVGGIYNAGNRYGLMTLEGEIVVDPVFSKVWRGGYLWGQYDSPPIPYFMLLKGAVSTSMQDWPNDNQWAMAAADGSWCTEFKYTMDEDIATWGVSNAVSRADKGLFVLDGTALVYLDGSNGQEKFRLEGISQDKIWGALWSATLVGDTVYLQEGYDGGYWAVDVTTKEWTALSEGEYNDLRLEGMAGEQNYEDYLWGSLRFVDGDEGLTIYKPDGEILVGENMDYGAVFREHNWATGEGYVRIFTNNQYEFYNQQGQAIANIKVGGKLWGSDVVRLVGDDFLITKEFFCGLKDADGNWIFCYYLPKGEWD